MERHPILLSVRLTTPYSLVIWREEPETAECRDCGRVGHTAAYIGVFLHEKHTRRSVSEGYLCSSCERDYLAHRWA
jgi:hypothetical protein